MEQQNTTVEPLVAIADEQIEKKFGKFKDSDALYTAYKNLESEFTRRNQELKIVKEASIGLETKVADLTSRLDSILDDEEFIDKCVANEQVYSKAVLAFLNSKSSDEVVIPVLTGSVGQATGVVPKKAKTLEEAKKLAKLIL